MGTTLLERPQTGAQRRAEALSGPWPALDRIIGGFKPARLYVIAGHHTSRLDEALPELGNQLARQGVVAYTAPARTMREFQCRLIAIETGLPAWRVPVDRNSDVAAAMERLRGRPLFLRNRDGEAGAPLMNLNVGTVRMDCRALARTRGLGAIVVEDPQMLSGSPRSVASGLHGLADEFGVPVVVGLKLTTKQSLGSTSPSRRRLGWSDLERVADVAMVMRRLPAASADLVEVSVLKNRGGQRGKVVLGQKARHVSLAEAV